MTDIFRPTHEPARTLYDVFQAEALKRDKRSYDEWSMMERMAVWRAARDYAQQHGLRVITLAEVEKAEEYAIGHVDYGAKWAYRVAEALKGEGSFGNRGYDDI